MKNIIIAAVATAVAAVSAAATACADVDDTSQVGNNHSVSVSIVNGVATVIVDGKQVFGEEAARYIADVKSKHRRP